MTGLSCGSSVSSADELIMLLCTYKCTSRIARLEYVFLHILPCRLHDLEAEGEVQLMTEHWPMLEIW